MNQFLKIKKQKTSKINLKILKYQVLGFFTKKSFWITLSIISLIGFIPTIVIIVSIFQSDKDTQSFVFKTAISINNAIHPWLLKYGFGLFFLSTLVSKIFREDWNNGTLLIVLSKPFNRTSIFLQKLAALLLVSLFNIVVFWFITNVPAMIFSFFLENQGNGDIFEYMIQPNAISIVGTIVFILTIAPIFIVFAVTFKRMRFSLLPSFLLIGLWVLDTSDGLFGLIIKAIGNDLLSKILSYLNVFEHLNFLILGIEDKTKDIWNSGINGILGEKYKYLNWYVISGVYSFISIVLIYLAWLKFKNTDFD